MTITVDVLLKIEMWAGARDYCKQFTDPQEAWDKCERPDWRIYLLHQKGKDVKPILSTVWPVGFIEDVFAFKRYFFIGLSHSLELLEVIRNLYPEPPK